MFDMKSHLSYQHTLNQLETAVLDSSHSMHQLKVLEVSSSLKLLVPDLWTLLWTILFIHLMCENCSLQLTTICSVLDMKSHLSYQHTLSQLETAVLDPSHAMQDVKSLANVCESTGSLAKKVSDEIDFVRVFMKTEFIKHHKSGVDQAKSLSPL